MKVVKITKKQKENLDKLFNEVFRAGFLNGKRNPDGLFGEPLLSSKEHGIADEFAERVQRILAEDLEECSTCNGTRRMDTQYGFALCPDCTNPKLNIITVRKKKKRSD